jgi:SAM-dependent methyltransferase
LHRRSYRHWTPRYLVDRIRLEFYERLHPDHPWLTKSANAILQSQLQNNCVGLEFGSGRSTLWFARRVRHLTSIEHDPVWFRKVSGMLAANRIANVSHLLREVDRSEQEAATTGYLRALDDFTAESLDFVLVDGVYRAACANGAIDKLRPGGMMILDNVNWYLPCESRAPNSRRLPDGPASPDWAQFEDRVSTWRRDWTTSGVTDTAIFYKP